MASWLTSPKLLAWGRREEPSAATQTLGEPEALEECEIWNPRANGSKAAHCNRRKKGKCQRKRVKDARRQVPMDTRPRADSPRSSQAVDVLPALSSSTDLVLNSFMLPPQAGGEVDFADDDIENDDEAFVSSSEGLEDDGPTFNDALGHSKCAGAPNFDEGLDHEPMLLVQSALTGDLLMRCPYRPSDDTADRVCEAVRMHVGPGRMGPTVSLHLLLAGAPHGSFSAGSTILAGSRLLSDAGVSSGDTVLLVQTPLRVVTSEFDGRLTVRCLRDYRRNHGGGKDPAEAEPIMDQVLFGGRAGKKRSFAVGHSEAVVLDEVFSANCSPTGQALVAVSEDGKGSVISLEAYDAGATLCSLEGRVMCPSTPSFSSDGATLAGVDGDFSEVAKVWCARTGRCLKTLTGHKDILQAVDLSADGCLVATASADCTACIHRTNDGSRVPLVGHKDVVNSAKFSKDGRTVVTGSSDYTARVWAVGDGRCLVKLNGHTAEILSAEFSPSGRHVLTFASDSTVRLWDAVVGKQLLVVMAEEPGVAVTAKFAPDGSKVLTTCGTGIRIYDVSTGSLLVSLEGHEDWVRSATFSPNGLLVASASYDRTARVWDATSGECFQVFESRSDDFIDYVEIIA